MRKTGRSPTTVSPWLSLRRRKFIANALGLLIVVVGGSLGITFGIIVVLYIDGGIQLIQDVLIEKDPTYKATSLWIVAIIIGGFFGYHLSGYFASWVIVKIGLLTEAERGPIEFTLHKTKKSD